MAEPNWKASHKAALEVMAKPDLKTRTAAPSRKPKTKLVAALAKADGRGRPKGAPTLAILVSVPEEWLPWLDKQMERRQVASRPMAIRAILGEARSK